MKKNIITRPTTQKIREAIFNILSNRVDGAVFLDLFSGTGMVGIDAYLYGAAMVYLVENNYNAVKEIEKNIVGACHGMPLRDIMLIKNDAVKFLENCGQKFDIIFIDPPYETALGDEALRIIDEKKLLNDNGIVIFEHYHKKEFLLNLHNISMIKEKKYGQTKLTFFRNK